MRFCVLGNFERYPSFYNLVSTYGIIQSGHIARPIQLTGEDPQHIKQQLDFFKPHIIMSHCLFDKKPEGWREKVWEVIADIRKKWGSKHFTHLGDNRSVPRYPHNISDFVDFGLVNNSEPETFEKYWKIPCFTWRYSCIKSGAIHAQDSNFAHDLVFTGSLDTGQHHANRKHFIDNLQNRIKVKTYPDKKYGNSMFLTDVISASAKGVLAPQIPAKVKGFIDVRPFQYIGAGAILFSDGQEIKQYFVPNKHYVEYKTDDVDDFIDKYNYYVNKNPNKGTSIRYTGFSYCQEYHSSVNRINQGVDIYKHCL